MNKFTIIPSSLRYAAAPSVDQQIEVNLDETSQQLVEYDRSSTVSLAQVFENERQGSPIFRPTFKVKYLYTNSYTGTTTYNPFKNWLYYVNPEESQISGIWKGFPQYYEFDIFRPNIPDGHFTYKAKSAYTYNWMYYMTYAAENDYEKKLFYTSPSFGTLNWVAKNGIPFSITNTLEEGSPIVQFSCVASHGLTPGEYVELSISYENKNIFLVYSLGNGQFDSEQYVFNLFNLGYTGTTFANGTTGTFMRVINPDNIEETKSKYYVRRHKVLTNIEDMIVSKAGFEKNIFSEEKKLEYSSITPDNVTRISQKTSSNAYNFTVGYDLNLLGLKDNQKRPISELYLSIINKGFTGYFNNPTNQIGLKQGWEFNITNPTNSWWSQNNVESNTSIPTSAYTKTNGATKTFYYNLDLNRGDMIDGDFCEWNDSEQLERVVSTYYQKLKYNQNVFQTTNTSDPNAPGFYYVPHNKMTIRVFSNYIENAALNMVEGIPSYAYYSNAEAQFLWRDIYTYGFIDEQGFGVDYPYLNSAHYPYTEVTFRLIPEGANYRTGYDFVVKPLIDGCE